MTIPTLERRAVERPVEYRAAADGESGVGQLEGYAATWDSVSRDLGGWVEEIDRAAFGEADESGSLDLSRHNRVLCRSEHDSRFLLGTTDANTLRLFLDDTGLRYEVDLPNTTAGRDAAELARRGDYRFSSFAFHALPNGVEWREDHDGRLVRRVTSAALVDVAPVADPAYWGSSVGKRNFDLDKIRADLRSSEETPQPAPPGDWEKAATAKAQAIQNRDRDFRRVTRSRARGGRNRHDSY